MDDWHLREKLFRMLLADAVIIEVPTTSLEVESTDQSTVLWYSDIKASLLRHLHLEDFGFVICGVYHVSEPEFKLEGIDLNPVLPRIVL